MQLCDWTCFQKSPSDWALISLFSISLGKYRFHIAEDKESLVRKDAEAMWDTCLPLTEPVLCHTGEPTPTPVSSGSTPLCLLKWENKSCIFNRIYFFIFLFFILAHSFKHPAELEQTEPTASQVQTWPEAAFSPPPPLLAQHPTPFLGHVIVRRPGDLYPNASYVHIFMGVLFIKAHKQQTELWVTFWGSYQRCCTLMPVVRLPAMRSAWDVLLICTVTSAKHYRLWEAWLSTFKWGCMPWLYFSLKAQLQNEVTRITCWQCAHTRLVPSGRSG